MGRPLRCIQQPSPFISFSNILNTSTSTTSAPSTTSDPISQYINIPISGYPCPSNFSVTTSTTSTTLSPLVITNNINNCTLYSFIFESQEIELDFDCVSPTPNSNSAIVRYQPCQSGVFINELIYNNKDLCVAGTVGNNIRILSGHGNLAKIGSCNNNITTSTTTTSAPTTTTTSTSTTTSSPNKLNIQSVSLSLSPFTECSDYSNLDQAIISSPALFINIIAQQINNPFLLLFADIEITNNLRLSQTESYYYLQTILNNYQIEFSSSLICQVPYFNEDFKVRVKIRPFDQNSNWIESDYSYSNLIYILDPGSPL